MEPTTVELIGKEFAKTGDLDPIHRWLLDAYDQRQAATYGISRDIARDRAEELVLQAEEFLAAARAYLQSGRSKDTRSPGY